LLCKNYISTDSIPAYIYLMYSGKSTFDPYQFLKC
jgi:hypothetical protein